MEGKLWAKPFRSFPQFQIFAKRAERIPAHHRFSLSAWMAWFTGSCHSPIIFLSTACPPGKPWWLFSTGPYCSLTKADAGADEWLHIGELKHDLYLGLWPGYNLLFQNWHHIMLLTPFQSLWLNCFHVPFTLVAQKAGFSLAMGDIFLAQRSHA